MFVPADNLSHPSLPLSESPLLSSRYPLPPLPYTQTSQFKHKGGEREWRWKIPAMTGLHCEWAQGKDVLYMPRDFTEFLMDG